MDKRVVQFSSSGLGGEALLGAPATTAGVPRSGAPSGYEAGRAWQLEVMADADSDLDSADRDLRSRETRWPLVPSIALILVLSAGLWLGIFVLAARLVGGA